MIKAIVADSENLVRKGFLSMFDWSSFGIRIVGEAADGLSALRLLETEEADLLFTDIALPPLSGFELLERVRLLYPHIRSVVLARHSECDSILRALRLGAIDYIVKTRLDSDEAETTMLGIVDRLRWEENNRHRYSGGVPFKPMPLDTALVFVPLSGEARDEVRDLLRLPIVRRNSLTALGRMWLSPLHEPDLGDRGLRDSAAQLGGQWAVVLVSGLAGKLQPGLQHLADSLERFVFYANPAQSPLRITYEQWLELSADNGHRDELTEHEDLRWALNKSGWEAFAGGIRERKPSPCLFAPFAEKLCKEWNGLLFPAEKRDKMIAAIPNNRIWDDWKSWFLHFAEQAERRAFELSVSKEVLLSLVKAVRYMKRNSHAITNQKDVADHVNMSRSYFSLCFARFAGQPFGSALQGMRIERAKRLLLETDEPIYKIAHDAGFEDDKYFSRLFRKLAGRLPSDYRAEGRRHSAHDCEEYYIETRGNAGDA